MRHGGQVFPLSQPIPSSQFNNKFTSQQGQQQQRNSVLTDTLRLFAPRSSNSSAVDAAPLALRFESIVAPCNRCRVKLAIATHTVSEVFEYVAPVNELNCHWRQSLKRAKMGFDAIIVVGMIGIREVSTRAGQGEGDRAPESSRPRQESVCARQMCSHFALREPLMLIKSNKPDDRVRIASVSKYILINHIYAICL
jgi:hypothetical protein